ncbi:MAG: DNA polymerase III subunit chi [Sulfuricella sp.]|nr:DNA polymerase III subunit chi [Sulfuricella sp.]
MTQIDFYTNVPDKFRIACQLAGKAYAQGQRTLIYTADARSRDHLDTLLWTTPAIGFIPHCKAGDELAEMTPVVIDHRGEDITHDDVLINLSDERPAFFSRFQRLLEIIGEDAAEKAAGRERWGFYKERGYPLNHHDLGKSR